MEEIKQVEVDNTQNFKISAMDFIRCGGDINKLITITGKTVGDDDLAIAEYPASQFIEELKVNGESLWKKDNMDPNSVYNKIDMNKFLVIKPRIYENNMSSPKPKEEKRMSRNKLRSLKNKKKV